MPANFSSIPKALAQPISPCFWVRRENGNYTRGDPSSFYGNSAADDRLTFDVSANKCLANVSLNGSLKSVTFYRQSYEVDHPLSGVWNFKDYTRTGPYHLNLIDGEECSRLDQVDWSLKPSLLENIFPFTIIDKGTLRIRIVTYAPINEDGTVAYDDVRDSIIQEFVEPRQ